MPPVTSLDGLSHYTSNIIARDIGNTSNDLIRDIGNTSNSISNRITDLYTNDITFQQDVTVSGNLNVNGTETKINTDSYTTEILEIVSTNVNDDKPVLKVVESGSVGNIVEVHKGDDEVFLINNSGDITTTGTINGVSPTEMSKLTGIGSTTIKDQLDGKQATITGAATTITSANLTANRALISDGSSKVAVSAVTSTELSKLVGIGSTTIATQLSNKQGTLSGSTDVTVKDLTAAGGIFTNALSFERNAPYFHITDTATSGGGSGVTASLHVNTENFTF
jgi:hypothetical protein